MAFHSQGTTATWNGITLGEVVRVSVDGLKADTVEITPKTSTSRVKAFFAADVDYGTVSVVCRGTAAMSSTNVGLISSLSIGGPGAAWSFGSAIFEGLGWSAGVGELQTYSLTFKLGT